MECQPTIEAITAWVIASNRGAHQQPQRIQVFGQLPAQPQLEMLPHALNGIGFWCMGRLKQQDDVGWEL